ncbi:MAG: DUF11 domain-containing protein, partial [Chloroflexi bacterium]|nr:DUF11 domain-containing protein [Chloroflexota bacterium]
MARAATLTVTNTSDSGAGSLRQAIADAASGDTITFDASLAGLTITLSSPLGIAQNLTLDARSLLTPITLSGNNAVRVLQVTGGQVSLHGLTIAHGKVAGIDNHGGGLRVSAGAAVTITHSAFVSNVAGEMGGAIYSISNLTVLTSTFTNNTTGVGADDYYVHGGAIGFGELYGSTAIHLVVKDSVFTGNSTFGQGGGQGGGLSVIGSGTGATALVERCAFFNNSVLNTSMGGGGMVVDGSTGAVAMSVVVRDSVFSDNWVTSSEIPHSSAGGGLLVVLADALVENTTFLRNRVDGVGGGMAALTDDSAPGQQITVRNSTFSANYASSEGGGLFSSNLTLQNSTFSGNGADNMMNSPTGVGGSIAYVTTLNYSNNIIANSQGGKDCAESFMWSGGATIVTNINNLVEDGTGSDGGVNFLTGDPRLTQLADNGGAVTAAGYALQTHALELDSPARDTGDPATCLPADQRRLARPQGSACDRGAHEVGALHLQATVTPASAAPYQGLVTYTLVLTNTGASLAASAWLSDTLPPGVTFEQWIVSPTHTTLVNDVINWGDDLPAGATRTWRFTARNTGALDQPGDYGDTLVNFAQAGSDAGYRAAEEAVLTVECGDPPMVQTRNMDGLCSLRQIIAD